MFRRKNGDRYDDIKNLETGVPNLEKYLHLNFKNIACNYYVMT